MIEKIVQIKNVGKFVNYCSRGDMGLRRLTLIYAENARGKTTLTAILRSLHTGDERLVHERQTLACTHAPFVHLRTSGCDVKLGPDGWTSLCPDMVIFDEAFVTQNVYSGHSVHHEHRRNLHRFALGEEAVQLATRLDEIAEAVRAKNSELAEVSREIQPHIQGAMSVDDYAALPVIEGVDDLISAKEKELDALKRTDEIQRKPTFATTTLPEFPLDRLTSLLAKQLSDVAADAERQVREHVSACVGDGGEAWLDRGVRYMQNDRCPFCGQSTVGVTLINAYKGYFSRSYRELKHEINDFASHVNTLLSDQALLGVQEVLNSNHSLAEYWLQHAAVELPSVEFRTINQSVTDLRQACQHVLNVKASAPLEGIGGGCTLNNAHQSYEQARQALAAYSETASSANAVIEEKKCSLEGGSISATEAELIRLKNSRVRHTDEVAELCKKLAATQLAKTRLEEERGEKREELTERTTQLLLQYHTRINEYLARFGADFQISGVTIQHYGGAPRIQYNLAIRGEDVQLDAGEGGSSPNFRNTLSSGDRTTLALAFFLARLDHDESINQKTIVFDDPLSSLDGHRRMQTRQEILRLVAQAEQVLVLSHDPYFLRMLCDGAVQSNAVKVLAIKRDGTDSIITQWDIDQNTRGDYFRCYSALIEYRERGPSGDLRDVARSIRPLLEGNLRVRFPGQFGARYSLKDIILTIQQANAASPLEPMKACLPDLCDINEYTKRYHHAENPAASAEPINDSELTAHIDRALSVLGGVFAAASQ